MLKAKEAFALACTEQLVPVLDDLTIRTEAWPLCEPCVASSVMRISDIANGGSSGAGTSMIRLTVRRTSLGIA